MELPKLPDNNPGERAIERSNKQAAVAVVPQPPLGDPRSRETEMLERIARLEDIIEHLAGGASGKVLSKASSNDYDFAWVDMPDPADVAAAQAAADAAQADADAANAKIDGASISGSCAGGDITVTFTPGS